MLNHEEYSGLWFFDLVHGNEGNLTVPQVSKDLAAGVDDTDADAPECRRNFG
jgi:hypothetical protein